MKAIIFTVILTALSVMATSCGDHTSHPPEHSDHFQKVNEQGDKAMGFSHKKTKHSFILLKDGGAIQVTVNENAGAETLTNVRKHLSGLPAKFSAGNFDSPMLTHGKVPPGVPAMQDLKAEIVYQYEELANGGRVLISTGNEKAITAVHEFLRFQIEDHRTGDPSEIREKL